MSDTQSPSAFRTGPVRAVVRAGSSDTAYIRIGSGDCVLLMIADLDSPLALTLMESLGARFRVIAPINRPSTSDFAGWLATFLDGLGVSTANLVSDKELTASSIAYCLIDAGRIDRLVLISDEVPAGTDALGAALDDPTEHATHPLMIVSASESPVGVAERIIRFLTSE